MFNSQSLQKSLRKRLDDRNISTRELERLAGLKESAVRNILLGKSQTPTIRTILAICDVLECKVEDLVEGTDSPESANTQIQHEWNPEVFLESCRVTTKILKDLSAQPKINEVLQSVKEIYEYSLGKDDKTVDESFSIWFLQRKFSQT